MSIDSGSIWWQMLYKGAKVSCALVTSYSNLFLITTACDNKCNDYPTSLSAMCLHFMWTTASLPFSYHQNKLDKNAVMHKLTMTAMVSVVSLMPFFCHCSNSFLALFPFIIFQYLYVETINSIFLCAFLPLFFTSGYWRCLVIAVLDCSQANFFPYQARGGQQLSQGTL